MGNEGSPEVRRKIISSKMAPLEVIGAGYARTGTTSLCVALNKLG